MKIKIEKNIELSPYSFYKVGGKADMFVQVSSSEELVEALEYAVKNSIPYIVIGSGSNILFSDRGLRGLVIRNMSSAIEMQGSGVLKAASGALIKRIMRFCLINSLSGAEFLTGVPGTLGGAVYGNAGACGGETSDILVSVEVFEPSSGLILKTKSELEFAYRSSRLQKRHSGAVVISAVLSLKILPRADIKNRMREVMSKRLLRHPSLLAQTCGCFFKNPSNLFKGGKISAGELLEISGAKNMSYGGARVSEKHCNFIVNGGGSSASDLIYFARQLQNEVKRKTGVILTNEVRIMPEYPPFDSLEL